MGWLDWSAPQALATEIIAVELALSAKTDLLKTIYGSGEKPRGDKPGKKVTASRFKAFVDRINGSRKDG